MDGLTSADLRGVLTFIEDPWAAAGEHPFPLETLQALARLIPCDVIGYAEIDRVARRELDYVGNDSGRRCRHVLGDRRRAPALPPPAGVRRPLRVRVLDAPDCVAVGELEDERPLPLDCGRADARAK